MSDLDLNFARSSARSVITMMAASGVDRPKLTAFLTEYQRSEGEKLPFEKFGYKNPSKFLEEVAGFTVYSDGRLFYKSEETKHLTQMIDNQKAKPRLAQAPPPSLRSRPTRWSPPPPNPTPRYIPTTSSLGKVPTPSSNLSGSANQPRLSTGAESASGKEPPISKRIPTINEMIPIFQRVNACYADQEVTMESYRRKVGEFGGNDAAAWLKMKGFNIDAAFSSFIIENSSGYTIQLLSGGNSISIRRSGALTERSLVQPLQPSNSVSYVNHEPYSTAYRVEKLACGEKTVDLSVDYFDSEIPNFQFCTAEGVQTRLGLMQALFRHPFENLSSSQLRRGTPCITLLPLEDNRYGRSTIIETSTEDKKARVYFVDLGVFECVAFNDIYRIPDVYLKDSVYSYPAVMVNPGPDGSERIGLKALQDIKLEIEYNYVKATILRYREDIRKYEVLIHGLMKPEPGSKSFFTKKTVPPVQALNGVHSSLALTNGDVASSLRTNGDVPSTLPANGDQASTTRTNGSPPGLARPSLTCQVRVLPTCETITVVQRGSSFFISSRVMSHLLGLEQDTFLSTLESNYISVIESWKLTSQDKALLDMVKERKCNLTPEIGETLIPIKAAAPLMRAYLQIESRTLDNEKHILRYLASIR